MSAELDERVAVRLLNNSVHSMVIRQLIWPSMETSALRFERDETTNYPAS